MDKSVTTKPAAATRAVAKTNPNDLRGLIESPKFAAELSKLIGNPKRFVRIAVNQLLTNPALAECERSSFLKCIFQAAQLGIEPDGRNAHLIPYRNAKMGKTICTLVLDYKGIIQLVMRTNKYRRVYADVVCDSDEFEFDMGVVKRHKIDFRKPRGAVYAAYALAETIEGSMIYCVMTRDEIEAVRRRSMAANAGPWVTDWAEMAKKTVFKRLSKWLMLTPEVAEAIEEDNRSEFGDVADQSILDIPQAEVPEVGEESVEVKPADVQAAKDVAVEAKAAVNAKSDSLFDE